MLSKVKSSAQAAASMENPPRPPLTAPLRPGKPRGCGCDGYQGPFCLIGGQDGKAVNFGGGCSSITRASDVQSSGKAFSKMWPSTVIDQLALLKW